MILQTSNVSEISQAQRKGWVLGASTQEMSGEATPMKGEAKWLPRPGSNEEFLSHGHGFFQGHKGSRDRIEMLAAWCVSVLNATGTCQRVKCQLS